MWGGCSIRRQGGRIALDPPPLALFRLQAPLPQQLWVLSVLSVVPVQWVPVIPVSVVVHRGREFRGFVGQRSHSGLKAAPVERVQTVRHPLQHFQGWPQGGTKPLIFLPEFLDL